MSYIRDGYVFVSNNIKFGRKGYGDLGQCVFIIGRSRYKIELGALYIPQKYWGKRIRLKVEVLSDSEGMPERAYSPKDIEHIRKKAYQKGYRRGKKKRGVK